MKKPVIVDVASGRAASDQHATLKIERLKDEIDDLAARVFVAMASNSSLLTGVSQIAAFAHAEAFIVERERRRGRLPPLQD